MSVFRHLLAKAPARLTAGALSGLLLVTCFAPFSWPGIVWVATLPLLLAAVQEPGLWRAFLVGCLAGAVFFAGCCHWLVGVMETYGGLGPALSVAVLVLFVLVFSAFFGVFALIEAWMARRSLSGALMLAPFLWVAIELARTYFITGFPWNLLGYGVEAEGLRQVASVTSVYGLSYLAVATSALFAFSMLVPRGGWSRLVPVAWIVLLVISNYTSLPPSLPEGSRQAILLQPDVPLAESVADSWAPWQHPEKLQALVAMSEEAARRQGVSAPIVVWAENPAPFYFFRDPIFTNAIKDMARALRSYVVVNTVTFAGPGDTLPKNSAIVLGPEGRVIEQYDKIHLVPFGEYVPAWAFPGKVGKITSQAGNFVPGSSYRVAGTPDGAISVFICYEDIFPQLVRRLVPSGPGLLVNISDDTWFGESASAAQELAMARFRAIENGRYLLRATNDGITAVIDPYGRVLDTLPRHRQAVLSGRFDFESRRTFYTAHGDVFAWLCVLVTVGLVALGGVRYRRGAAV